MRSYRISNMQSRADLQHVAFQMVCSPAVVIPREAGSGLCTEQREYPEYLQYDPGRLRFSTPDVLKAQENCADFSTMNAPTRGLLTV